MLSLEIRLNGLMQDASLHFAEWLTCLPFFVSDRRQSSSAVGGFKPNDNAKDIKGSLLRLALLLLRFLLGRWAVLGWSGVAVGGRSGCQVLALAVGVNAGLLLSRLVACLG